MRLTFSRLGSVHIFCKATAETAGNPDMVPPETGRKTLVNHQVATCLGDLCERCRQAGNV